MWSIFLWPAFLFLSVVLLKHYSPSSVDNGFGFGAAGLMVLIIFLISLIVTYTPLAIVCLIVQKIRRKRVNFLMTVLLGMFSILITILLVWFVPGPFTALIDAII